MAFAVFPASITLPMPDGYALEEEPRFRRSSMDAGNKRQRREFDQGPTNMTIRWEMVLTEYRTFRDFWKNDIDHGARVFLMDVWAVDKYEPALRCRFTEPYRNVYKSFDTFVVEGKVEILDSVDG